MTTKCTSTERTVRRILRSRRGGLRVLFTALFTVALMFAHTAWAVASPQISVSDVTVSAPGAATFVVSLSAASSSAVTVRFRTANGSATAPGDYQPTSGTLTFAPGETSKTVTVRVKASPVPAAEKVFYLQLFDASNATISRPQGTATIVNNLPTI